jgi:uncharacterized protein YjdB
MIATITFFSVKHIGTRYITSGKFEYKINEDGTATLIKYNKLYESECITIPFSIDGYTVTVIASNAVDCSNSEEIIIADSITTIKKNAFKNCQRVNKISIPSHLIDSEGFSNLINISVLIITSGQNGFMVDFNTNEERIWNNSSDSIFKLVISDDVKYLSNNAFRDLKHLEIIEFSETVESIGEYCFYNDCNLKSFVLPLSLKAIKKHAFDMEKTEEIETIVLIPQSVTYLEECCLSKNYKYIVYENSEAAKYIKKNDLTYTLIDLNFAETSTSIKVGETMQLKVVDSNILSDEIKYYSSNPKIATISQEGLLTANSIGAVKITVRTNSGENSVIFDVTVSDENASEIRYLILDLDDNVVLSPNDHDCFIGSNEEFTYTSSDENIVLVDESGNLEILEAGTVSITISSGGTNVIYYMSIAKMIKNIKINQTVINLKKGNTFELNVSVYPADAANKTLTYYSSNPEIAQVTNEGKIIANKNGTAIITVKTNDGSDITKKVAVNVSRTKVSCQFYKLGLMVNKKFRLRCSVNDNSTLLYYSSDEKIATVDNSGVIYPKKSGTCYITISNENYTSAITVPVKVYNAFSYGLDLSEWNGRYMTADNFQMMKNDGIDFVLLRAAYSNDYKDPIFERNYNAAKEAGLDVGAYHYIISTTVEDAIKEAKWMLECIEGKKFEYPIIVDVETGSHKYLDSYTFNALVNAYCDVLKEAGYYPAVYSYSSMMRKYNFKYDVWVAHWDTTTPYVYNDNYTMWQFTSKGKVEGVTSTNVDINICFVDYPSIIKDAHLNGY